MHDFDKMTAGTSSSIEDNDTRYIGTHKEIGRRGHINKCNLIEALLIESNIILDDDSGDCLKEKNDQISSSPQPTVNLDKFPRTIEIVK
eukprot:10627727-Ditylum_brightwellii.AAC.1